MRNTLRSLLRDRAVMDSLKADADALRRELAPAGAASARSPRLEGMREAVPEPQPEPQIEGQLDALLDGRETALGEHGGLFAAEAIILLRGRPVLLVQDDQWQPPASAEIARWLGHADDGNNTLRQRLPSIGRVEIIGDDDQDYVGTGWMLSDDVLITNRHVADAFGVARDGGFGFRQWPDGRKMQVRTDFKREYQRDGVAQVSVRDLIHIAPAGDVFPDFALLRVERNGAALPPPIDLDDAPLVADPANLPTLAVVGYPAEDVRNDASVSRRIFDGIYRVKRLSPGRLMTLSPNGRVLEHDCTTLGGNSGSPVINLATGRVCGLHFAGTYRSRNFAVTAGWLKAQLAELEAHSVFVPPRRKDAPPTPAQGRVRDAAYFDGRGGYRADFLGARADLQVPLPGVGAAQQAHIATSAAAPDGELKYRHFSVLMRGDRRLPFFTAVNIDGNKLFNFPRSRDVWFLDGRLDNTLQAGEALYEGNPLDRGHLVRRLDPAWGDTRQEAKEAELDTFVFTNCAPQHSALNQRTWLALEEYILGNANTRDFKASIFSGPVLDDDDRRYRGVGLPRAFWKVAVMVNDATGSLSATGYLLSQAGLVRGLEFVYGPYRSYQVPLSLIEGKTGLNFDLGLYDPLHATEGDSVREINGPQDLVL